jgi:hypothetical protein
LDPAVIEDEFLGNGFAAVNFDASTAGTDIDNIANGGRAFQINKYRPGFGH